MACGRKGPPLAPIVYTPRPVTALTVKRVEGDIVLQFTVPTVNTDNSGPADLDRLEVYAHTGPLPATPDYVKYGTLVRSIEVKQPAVSDPEGQKAEGRGQTESGSPSSADLQVGQVVGEPMVEQGWATTVRETLTEKHMETGPMPPTRAVPLAATSQVETLETPGTVNFAPPVWRYYTVVGVSRSRNRRGPYAGPIRVPLVLPLQAPEKPETSYTANAISLSWPGQPEDIVPPVPIGAPPAIAAPAVLPVSSAPAAQEDVEPLGFDKETSGTIALYEDVETPGTANPRTVAASKPVPPVTPRFGYNVYEAGAAGLPADSSAVAAPDAKAEAQSAKAGAAGAIAAPIAPLNAALLTAPAFNDPRVEFGSERCYVVRRVEMVGTVAIESPASAPACVTPVDKFAPAAPKTLASVASSTAVSLIWEANTEADLGGYVVLRGDAPGDKLAPLTPAPISDAAYLDTTIRRTRTYVYEVVAVDKAGNQSAPSNRVEETIR